jgi:hypothetical protein
LVIVRRHQASETDSSFPRSGPKEGADIMPTRQTLHERLFRPASRVPCGRAEPDSSRSFEMTDRCVQNAGSGCPAAWS